MGEPFLAETRSRLITVQRQIHIGWRHDRHAVSPRSFTNSKLESVSAATIRTGFRRVGELSGQSRRTYADDRSAKSRNLFPRELRCEWQMFRARLHLHDDPKTATGAASPNTACSTTTNTDRRASCRSLISTRPASTSALLRNIKASERSATTDCCLDVRKRTSHGLTLGTNYTWSHCLGSDQDTLNGNLYDSLNTYIYVNDRDRGISNCTSDRRHILN